jgi:L-threonylcarbamoyladenylate synthase
MILPFRTQDDARAAAPIVAAHLAAGKLLAYPTETVYGLGSAPNKEALASLARLKGRPPKKPFLLLVSSRRMAEEYGLDFSAAARAMADAFWPGPLTLVLPGGEGRLPPELRGAEGGIAVRQTSQPEVALMISLMGHALTSTSANRPGQPTSPGADGIISTFGEAEQSGELLVLDGGVLGNVPPSTLVDCTAPLPRIIRDGAIPRAELRRMVGRLAP